MDRREFQTNSEFYERARVSLTLLGQKTEQIAELSLPARVWVLWQMVLAAFQLRRALGDMLIDNGMPATELPTLRLLALDYFTRAGVLRLAGVFRRLAQLIEIYPGGDNRTWFARAYDETPLQWGSDGLLAPVKPHMHAIAGHLTPRINPCAGDGDQGINPRDAVAPASSRPEVRAGHSAFSSRRTASLAARCWAPLPSPDLPKPAQPDCAGRSKALGTLQKLNNQMMTPHEWTSRPSRRCRRHSQGGCGKS